MPPDSIYLTKPREYSDYQYMHAKGVQWFALLDVSALPLAPPGGTGEEHLQPIDTFGHIGHGGGVTGNCANYTDEYVSRMIATLRPMVDRMDKDGMLSSAYIYGFDENPVSCEPQVRKLFGATKKAFPTLRYRGSVELVPNARRFARGHLDFTVRRIQCHRRRGMGARRQGTVAVPLHRTGRHFLPKYVH
jgi:hypothetical protein